VLGEVDIQTGQVRGYVEDVSISGFKIPSIDLTGTRDATATKNRVFSRRWAHRHQFLGRDQDTLQRRAGCR
jgi:hypothetical protein